MDASIREYHPADQTQVLELSLRAWEPIFASMEDVLGPEIYIRLHGDDWRVCQSKSVKDVLADPAIQVWVGEDVNGKSLDSPQPQLWTPTAGSAKSSWWRLIPAHQVDDSAPH
jgi:hypothetical protein